MSASNVIRVHDTIHLADNNTAGQQTLHKERMNGSLNIETTPLTRTSQMNDITRETKGQAKRKNNEWQEPATSPTRPNPNPGRP